MTREKKHGLCTWAGILIAALPGAAMMTAAYLWAGPTIRKLIDVAIKMVVKG